jgi:hypothetical protein
MPGANSPTSARVGTRVTPAAAIGYRRLQGEPELAPETTRWTSAQPSRNAELGLSTRAIHHGYDPAEEHGALTPPIFMTSTYAFETAEAGSELFHGERAGYIYGRTRNCGERPTSRLRAARRAVGEGLSVRQEARRDLAPAQSPRPPDLYSAALAARGAGAPRALTSA